MKMGQSFFARKPVAEYPVAESEEEDTLDSVATRDPATTSYEFKK